MAVFVWQLALLSSLTFVGASEKTAPSQALIDIRLPLQISADHADDVPTLVANATDKLATQMSTLLGGKGKVSLRLNTLRRKAVPGATVHTEVGQALDRLQRGLKATSASMSEWAVENQKHILAAVLTSEYRRQHDLALHARHVLDTFVNASHQRQAPFLLKVSKLEAAQRDLEAEIQQRQHALDMAKAEKVKKLRHSLESNMAEQKKHTLASGANATQSSQVVSQSLHAKAQPKQPVVSVVGHKVAGNVDADKHHHVGPQAGKAVASSQQPSQQKLSQPTAAKVTPEQTDEVKAPPAPHKAKATAAHLVLKKLFLRAVKTAVTAAAIEVAPNLLGALVAGKAPHTVPKAPQAVAAIPEQVQEDAHLRPVAPQVTHLSAQAAMRDAMADLVTDDDAPADMPAPPVHVSDRAASELVVSPQLVGWLADEALPAAQKSSVVSAATEEVTQASVGTSTIGSDYGADFRSYLSDPKVKPAPHQSLPKAKTASSQPSSQPLPSNLLGALVAGEAPHTVPKAPQAVAAIPKQVQQDALKPKVAVAAGYGDYVAEFRNYMSAANQQMPHRSNSSTVVAKPAAKVAPKPAAVVVKPAAKVTPKPAAVVVKPAAKVAPKVAAVVAKPAAKVAPKPAAVVAKPAAKVVKLKPTDSSETDLRSYLSESENEKTMHKPRKLRQRVQSAHVGAPVQEQIGQNIPSTQNDTSAYVLKLKLKPVSFSKNLLEYLHPERR